MAERKEDRGMAATQMTLISQNKILPRVTRRGEFILMKNKKNVNLIKRETQRSIGLPQITRGKLLGLTIQGEKRATSARILKAILPLRASSRESPITLKAQTQLARKAEWMKLLHCEPHNAIHVRQATKGVTVAATLTQHSIRPYHAAAQFQRPIVLRAKDEVAAAATGMMTPYRPGHR